MAIVMLIFIFEDCDFINLKLSSRIISSLNQNYRKDEEEVSLILIQGTVIEK